MVMSIGVYKLGLFSMDHSVYHPQNVTPESILLSHSFSKHYHHKDNYQPRLAHAHRPFLFIETSPNPVLRDKVRDVLLSRFSGRPSPRV